MPPVFRVERVLRPHPPFLLRGSLESEPGQAVLEIAPAVAPWLEPRSPFFGGRGLLPPFRSPHAHSAAAWRTAEPARLLGQGAGPDGTWIALRRPGARPLPPRGRLDRGALLAALLRALARLHARDVLHRDLRPTTVGWDPERGRVVWLELAVPRVEGLGPVGPIGARAWRPPEVVWGEGDAREDLHAAGRLARRYGRGAVPGGLLDALCAPRPEDRPASAREALAALGEDVAALPEPRLSPPHPRARAWWAHPRLAAGPWADAEALARAAEAAGSDHALAIAVVRLLVAETAAPAGGPRWRAVARLCDALAERTGDDLHRAQADEARARAAGRGPAPSPALRALARPVPDLLAALSALDLGLRLEGAAGRGRALAGAHPPLRLPPAPAGAAADAASRASASAAPAAGGVDPSAGSPAGTAASPEPPPAAEPRPSADLDALRVRAWVEGVPPAGGGADERQRLTARLLRDHRKAARRHARVLARAGRWDPAVAALLLGDRSAELRARARRELAAAFPPAPVLPEPGAALAALAAHPDDDALWHGALASLLRTGRPDLAATTVVAAGSTAGPRAWVLLGVLLLAAGRPRDAAEIAPRAFRALPGDPLVRELAGAVPLAPGARPAGAAEASDVEEGGASSPPAEEAPWPDRPDHPAPWLLRALLAERPEARALRLEVACALGLPAEAARLAARAALAAPAAALPGAARGG